MKTFLGAEKRQCLNLILWGIYYVFIMANNIYSVFPPNVLLLINLIMIFMISSATHKKSLKQRCIFALLICAIWMFVEIIVLIVLTAINFNAFFLQEAGSFISDMCMLLLSVTINYCSKGKRYYEISLRNFLIILLIPISSIYIMHNVFLIASAHNEYTLFSAITSFMLLLVNYVIFEVYDWICRDAELREQNRMYEQQLELCSQQSEERERLYLEIRRIRHDLKNHLSGLLGMIQTKQIEDAEKYIIGMLDDGIGNRPEEISHSGNIIVDSLIDHKYALAQKDSIKFDVNILIPESLPFHNEHLVVILGNLIENALEACREVEKEERYIHLNISYVKGVLQLSTKNNYRIKRKKDSAGHYLTSKNDSIYHGLGLSLIEHTVSIYQGAVDINDNGHEFQVKIIMYGSTKENNN